MSLVNIMKNAVRSEARRMLLATGVKLKQNGEPALNSYHVMLLKKLPPKYWTRDGLVAAKLKKVTTSHINGETIAYYDVELWNRQTRLMEITTYIWAVRGDGPEEIKRHPTRYVRPH